MDVACTCVGVQPETAWQPSPGDQGPMYDGPDVPAADLPEDVTGPEPQTVPLDVSTLHKVPGYESVGYYADTTPPYIPPPYSFDTQHKDNDISTDNQIPCPEHISSDEARNALRAYASEHCCYGKSVSADMTLVKITGSNAYHYTLETFTEMRSTAWEQEPYTGQPVDTSIGGRAPLPWEIHCHPTQMFHDEIHLIEVPHTAAIVPCLGCRCQGCIRCFNCLGRGFKRCISCHGSGRLWKSDPHGHRHVDTCWRCHGTGRKRCISCGGDGRIVCRTCQGYKHLKCFINLRVEYKNNFSEHIVDHTDMPSHLIKTVTGDEVFQQTQPRVWPIVNHPEEELCKSSEALLGEHERRFHFARIIMQRQRLRVVPVSECSYLWKNKPGRFWVYGQELSVYAPTYPQKICCGCSVV